MEINNNDSCPQSPIIKTVRRDSGLYVAFDVKPKSSLVRRDSGLEISALDNFGKSRSVSLQSEGENDDLDITTVSNLNLSDINSRECGSPINRYNRFSKLFRDLQNKKFNQSEDSLSDFAYTETSNMSVESSFTETSDGENTETSEVLSYTRDGYENVKNNVQNQEINNTSTPPDQISQIDTPITPRSSRKVLLRRQHHVKEEQIAMVTTKPPRPESCRPNSVTKRSVTPRVQLMLNSEIFKKYLSKHENLIDKISMRQGRGTGLKKALSNLDISKLDFGNDDTGNEKKSNLNLSSSLNNEILKPDWEDCPVRTRSNTYCEADFKQSSVCDKENSSMSVTETILQSQDDDKIRKSRRKKFTIPSFHEFKMSKHFKQIPEEDLGDEDRGHRSCDDCDKNRTLESENKKSRSYVRCQRIKEKYLQNHEEVSTSQNYAESVNCIDEIDTASHSVSRLSCDIDTTEHRGCSSVDSKTNMNSDCFEKSEIYVKKKQKVGRKSEIPVRIKSSSPITSPRQNKPVTNNSEMPLLKGKENSAKIEEDIRGSLPPRHLSDASKSRVILRASRKRKIPQKKPFLRSQSDSHLKVDGALSNKPSQKIKSKPPPIEIQTVHSCETLSQSASSSPLLTESLIDSINGPMSAVVGSFDYSPDQIIKFQIEDEIYRSKRDNSMKNLHNVENFQHSEDNLIELSEDNSSAISQAADSVVPGEDNLQAAFSVIPGGDNSSAISNVELWSDNSEKVLEHSTSQSSYSDYSDKSSSQSTSENISSLANCISGNVDFILPERSLHTDEELLSLDSKSSVMRSTSDVCNSTTSDALRKRRERKERPYKSDPFTGSSNLPAGKPKFPSLSKDDMFEVDEISLEEVEEEEISITSDQDWEKERKKQHRLSDVSIDSGVIGPEYPPSPTSTLFSTDSSIDGSGRRTGERNLSCRSLLFSESTDDGIKSDSTSSCFWAPNGCNDCGTIDSNNRTKRCSNCEKKNVERKEIIQEIKETEESYGRDLAILKEHFYKPMKSAGLLSLEHLEGIFLNLEELIHVNAQFVKKLQLTVDNANKKGDENLRTVSIGNLFLDSSSLILAFENYCVNQGQAAVLLEQLEKEKELLRIFLQVSQDENPILRRMPLKSFLMVPVQRIMRYPLLLERLYKFTSGDHSDKSALMEAKLKIEDILDHINSKTKHSGTIKLKRKISDNLYQRISITEKIEVNKVAIEVLGWNRKEVCDIIMSRLQVAPLNDQTWAAKRLKTLKFTTVHCVLLTLGQSDADITEVDDDSLLFAKKSKVIQAALVLIKEKNGKYQTFREPFMLNRCVVSVDPEVENAFELSDLNKEPHLFKGDDVKELTSFLQTVKQQTLNLGIWRKRRNALPNIMIKHMV